MHQIGSDRRQSKKASFPLVDCHDKQITFERRMGKDRRARNRTSVVAADIIDSLCIS